MTKINERKNIIGLFKSVYKKENKGIEKRIQFLKIMTILYLIPTIVIAGILVLSIFAEIFDYKILKWEKSALIVILSVGFTIRIPNQFYEFKLLKHLKDINSKSEFDGIDKLNVELKNIIDKLNFGFKNNWIEIILGTGISILGIWQMGLGDSNPYWGYMKLPTLAFYGIIIFRFIIRNKKLNKNINKTEKYW